MNVEKEVKKLKNWEEVKEALGPSRAPQRAH
jgi:hypothetical protein